MAWREQHLLVPHPSCLTNVNKHFPLYFAGVAVRLSDERMTDSMSWKKP